MMKPAQMVQQRFRSLRETWADITSPAGRLMITVIGGIAEFERELIRARTGDGIKRANAAGVHDVERYGTWAWVGAWVVTCKQATSYCETAFALAACNADGPDPAQFWPAVPPVGEVPTAAGSLNGAPGDAAALPGVIGALAVPQLTPAEVPGCPAKTAPADGSNRQAPIAREASTSAVEEDDRRTAAFLHVGHLFPRQPEQNAKPQAGFGLCPERRARKPEDSCNCAAPGCRLPALDGCQRLQF